MKTNLVAALAALLVTTAFADVTFTYIVRTDGNAAITACSKSASGAVAVPSTIGGKAVVALQGAFNGCKKITSITIPATVQEIGPNTFKNTAKLKKLTFAADSPGVSLGNDAFSGSKLKTLTLPANSTVSDFAFYDSKITSLEVCDTTPVAKLANIDDFLSPYNPAGTKLMSKIKELVVPAGCVAAYTPSLDQFLFGRKKKNRGTVRAQYPRVFAEKTTVGGVYQGSGYFKVNGKKVANGTAVKPGTKVQFVAVATAGFTPQHIYYGPKSDFVATLASTDFLAVWTFKMPQHDHYCKASFTDRNDEVNAIDLFAGLLASFAPEETAIKGQTNVKMLIFDTGLPVFVSQTTVSVKGLPKGLSVVKEGNKYYVKGVPKQALDRDNAPAFVILKGASGYSRAFRLPLAVSGSPAVSSTVTANPGISQAYAKNVLSILAGMPYAKADQPVLISAAKKISVKASGLPKGVKLLKVNNLSYTLAGRPTKTGVYIATLSVTVGGKKETHRIAYEVLDNPLAGSYRGFVASKTLGCGAAAMSVGKDGKATLAFTEGRTKTTVTGYPNFESGFVWNPSTQLVGRFRYTFTVPKDKKRKLGKRALTLAYVTDGSSGVSCSARIRQGPISGFSLDKVETLRLFPVMPAVQVKKTKFYTNNTYVRDHAGFSVLIGSSDAQSSGKAFWAAVDYNYDSGTVDLVGRLPAGKAFSTTLPLVASYYANDSWSVNEAYNYRAVEVAPLVAADNDGEVYVIKIPADPSEFYNNASVGHEAVGLYAWNRFGPGLFGRHSGAYTRNSRKESLLSARAVVSASPKLKIAFNETPWSVATTLSTAVDSTTINVASNGKATYEFDNLTGLWKFSFIYNGLLYMFEGTPTQGSGFAGIVGRSADGKSWAWGAAKVE